MIRFTVLVSLMFTTLLQSIPMGPSTPTATVECGQDGTAVNISITGFYNFAELPLSYSGFNLNSNGISACSPSFSDPNLEYGPFNAIDCAMPTQRNNSIVYTFDIAGTHEGSNAVLIPDYNFVIECIYDAEGVTQSIFDPQDLLVGSASGSGVLQFNLSLYSDIAFTLVLSQDVELRTTIYGRVDLQTEQSFNLKIVRCFAFNPSNSFVSFDLITNSCPSVSDRASTIYQCDMMHINHASFFFTTFRFPSATNVFLQCSVVACIGLCPNCQACTRKRRNVDNPSSETEYEVTSGPYRFVEAIPAPAEEDADTEEQEAHEPAVSINVIIIAAVSGFVAIVIAVCVSVVIVLRMSMRRENSTGNETVAAPVENQGFEVNDINKTV